MIKSIITKGYIILEPFEEYNSGGESVLVIQLIHTDNKHTQRTLLLQTPVEEMTEELTLEAIIKCAENRLNHLRNPK